ncbi:MAG: hypothetical protein KF866_08915 [Phycisphaeraceae bacterium]|nr:hypothetical protein [Phycisphaeraceae bacterium]MCW5753999.1 hypothetical protein [Phycisphaeraceae bacterium]
MPDIEKSLLFAQLGYGGDAAPYERALQEAGLSRPAKPRISLDKRDRVASLFASRFMRVCARGDCQAKAREHSQGREVVRAHEQQWCELCGGSPNQTAIDEMVQACRVCSWRRLCVVGGSPTYREELRTLVSGRIDLRLVDGTLARSLANASADVKWADRTVLWGGTQLDHRVSENYRGDTVITVPHRSIAELARAVVESARKAGA